MAEPFIPLTLEEAAKHVGERVVFHLHGKEAMGVISSVGFKNVFVRFALADFGEACDPERLSLAL